MKSKLFLERFGWRSGAISKLSYFGLTWDEWAKLTKITRSLNYGCNFDTNGCSSYSEGSAGKCCCTGCLEHIGYLDLIPDSRRAIKIIASFFNDKYGFWRQKKGCILPAKYRSSICIAHRCYKARTYRNNLSVDDPLEQMILYFLDTWRSSHIFGSIQIRTIIKELIKEGD